MILYLVMAFAERHVLAAVPRCLTGGGNRVCALRDLSANHCYFLCGTFDPDLIISGVFR